MANDGGPAFPSEQGVDHHGQWNQTYQSGMSLLEYFAGEAMKGMLAGGKDREPNHWVYGHVDELVSEAYLVAGAMIAEGKRRMEPNR